VVTNLDFSVRNYDVSGIKHVDISTENLLRSVETIFSFKL
jgi:hypothetical protein